MALHPAATEIVREFVKVANELAELPQLRAPEHERTAEGLLDICKRLAKATDHTRSLINRFLYFNFKQDGQVVREKLLEEKKEYEAVKWEKRHELSMACSEIWRVYTADVKSDLSFWFRSRPNKLREAEEVISKLSHIDDNWVDFLSEEVFARLDRFTDKVVRQVLADDTNAAYETQVRFISETKELTTLLETFTSELTKLINRFADAAVHVHR